MPVRDERERERERERKGRKDFERVCMCGSTRFNVLSWEYVRKERVVVKDSNWYEVIFCSI